jgi:hypothetical protein
MRLSSGGMRRPEMTGRTLSFWKVMFSAQEVLDLAAECQGLEDFETKFTDLAETRSRTS